MQNNKIKIGILTSTRADFGIYQPLLEKLFFDQFFESELIVFGTHLSKNHGYTIDEIRNAKFPIKHQLGTLPKGDTAHDISKTMAHVQDIFADFWKKNKFDLVFALGDRYEMFAAVVASSPFNVKIAHIHAGETTLGAIDNAYRHSISLMSEYLFVSTEEYKKRAIEITQKPNNVFDVGALSIENLENVKLFTKEEFLRQFHIDLNKPTILSTFHPETVEFERNKKYINELLSSFDILAKDYQIVITMPNADTKGLMIRKEIEDFAKNNKRIILVESFGMKGYLSCMKHAAFLIGNTSSGFVEAAFFPKWVINIGDRQKGRIITKNIFSTPANKQKILEKVKLIENKKVPNNCNIYGKGDTSSKIINILKNQIF